MAALTTYGQDLALNYLFNTEALTRPTGWFVALHTGDPGADGTANEVSTGVDADYVRKTIALGSEANGQVASSSEVAWTVNSASAGYTVTHASIWTAESGGSPLVKSALLATRTLVANDVLTFNIGEIVASAI
jgi:hypothetical protein